MTQTVAYSIHFAELLSYCPSNIVKTTCTQNGMIQTFKYVPRYLMIKEEKKKILEIVFSPVLFFILNCKQTAFLSYQNKQNFLGRGLQLPPFLASCV